MSDFRMTVGDAVAILAIALAVAAALIGLCLYVDAKLTMEQEAHLYHEQTESMMIWMEGCVNDGSDPWQSYLAYIRYLHGPPILVKPYREC
jgi:hypothetical protein